jgi:hypothetical protein
MVKKVAHENAALLARGVKSTHPERSRARLSSIFDKNIHELSTWSAPRAQLSDGDVPALEFLAA